MMQDLYGQYNHSLDAKNRVSVPFRFRERLGEHFVITQGLNGCLFVFPEDEFQRLAEMLNSLPMAKGQALQHFFFSGAADVEPDKNGRVILPAHLKKYAGIDKDVVINGCGRRAEIWNEEEWNRRQAGLTAADVAAMMEELNI